jgi:hypothetical protein
MRPLTLALVLTILAAVICGGAPNVLADQADDILDKYIKATGGKGAHAKIKNRVTTMTLEPIGSGLKLQMTAYAARPNKNYSLVESPAIGKIEQGTDGNVVWELSDVRGPIVKEGSERAFILRASTFDKDIAWEEYYKKVEYAGIDSVGGQPCNKVLMTPTVGELETRYFDVETNLLAKVELTVDLEAGKVPVVLFLSDYQQTDGVMIAHKTRRLSGGQEIEILVESIEHNVEIPADRFDLPEEIQKFLEEQKADSEEAGAKKSESTY